MQSVNGELIRQIRRQYNLTQTELGGDRFSKSYVSAVERNKIMPSHQALEYFAEQLGKPGNYFTNLLEQAEDMNQLVVVDPSVLGSGEHHGMRAEELTLLDILLEDGELSSVMGRQQLRALSPQVVVALPVARQARYHFLSGRQAQEEGDLEAALHEFERALALAPVELQVAVLNELGLNYYLSQNYQTALAYHLRALQLWKQQRERLNGTTDALGFKIEFNCGNDYRALAAYQEAGEHYEKARRYLSTEHDMKTAAALYYGLGYCVYGAIEQAWNGPGGRELPAEAVGREYQRASSFLLQSRTLYQVGGNRLAEAEARLMQARVLLDLCERRQQLSRQTNSRKSLLTASSTGLLSEAEEQCRQVLLIGMEEAERGTAFAAQVDSMIYVASAYLVQVFVRHAALARLSDYKDTATRELMVAAYLCGEVVKSLPRTELPLLLARQTAMFNLNMAQQGGSTVGLTGKLSEPATEQHSPFCVVEVCMAAGEVTEELGYSAAVEENADQWFEHANHWLQAGLNKVCAVVKSGGRDYGYLARSYRRCFDILDERMEMAPELAEQTTRTLVRMLKEAVNQLSQPVLHTEEAI